MEGDELCTHPQWSRRNQLRVRCAHVTCIYLPDHVSLIYDVVMSNISLSPLQQGSDSGTYHSLPPHLEASIQQCPQTKYIITSRQPVWSINTHFPVVVGCVVA